MSNCAHLLHAPLVVLPSNPLADGGGCEDSRGASHAAGLAAVFLLVREPNGLTGKVVGGREVLKG